MNRRLFKNLNKNSFIRIFIFYSIDAFLYSRNEYNLQRGRKHEFLYKLFSYSLTKKLLGLLLKLYWLVQTFQPINLIYRMSFFCSPYPVI